MQQREGSGGQHVEAAPESGVPMGNGVQSLVSPSSLPLSSSSSAEL